jgi:hypothetical protein
MNDAGVDLGSTSVASITTLDRLPEIVRADAIKIDIEGAELLFLRGADPKRGLPEKAKACAARQPMPMPSRCPVGRK